MLRESRNFKARRDFDNFYQPFIFRHFGYVQFNRVAVDFPLESIWWRPPPSHATGLNMTIHWNKNL